MKPYNCENKPNPVSQYRAAITVQDGWRNTDIGKAKPSRQPVMVKVKTEWNPVMCGYRREDRIEDPRCAGCKWRDWDHKREQ